ncbi:family 28 glycosyltransferase [Coniochaeta sp. PMI_546]|nr:family 28 glycosyltransferase [Coniochaeta sp. PMI_546]
MPASGAAHPSSPSLQPTQTPPLASGSSARPPLHPQVSSASQAQSRPTAAQEERTVRRVSKKLQKKRREDHHTPTMELPERLKEHGDDADAEEDVLHPQGLGGGMFMNMNQSIFGLIAAAGSKVDFTDRFEGQSSDEEGDDDGTSPMAMTEVRPGGGLAYARRDGRDALSGAIAQTTVLRKPTGTVSGAKSHRRKVSESKLLRSVPGLSRLSSKVKPKSKSKSSTDHIQEEAEPEQDESTAPIPFTSPSIEVTHAEERIAPVMSRMLEARAQMAARPSFDLDRLSTDQRGDTDSDAAGPTELAKRLKDIFLFDHPEEVIEEYPCWLLQHVLLQGYMYITAKHIAFYAYLPKKAHEVVKSGYLSKSGKRNPKFNRYWFRLKGDVFSYYRDSQSLYFPSGQIDLRYGISADITDKDKEGVNFSLVTHHRTYNFRADSAPSAKEWVKSLQRVIFRSHNDGDSVKISLPIENVIDIEETQMLDFADTCKIRVIDNDETYAIDEYFFSFFTFGREALNVLKILIEDASSQAADAKELDASQQLGPEGSHGPSSKKTSTSSSRPLPPRLRTNKLAEGVKATLSPISLQSPSNGPSPRASGDFTRSSFDAFRQFGRRSLDVNQITSLQRESPRRSFSDARRADTQKAPEKQSSSDSYVQSLEDPSQASLSALVASGSDDPSASQILRGSDVFHSPTIRRSESASRSKKIDASTRPGGARKSSGIGSYSVRHAATAQDHATSDGMPQTPTLQSITKMGSYPLQRAGAFADFLNRQSRRMSTLLATESMGYVEKVSGMWKGGKKHYEDPSGLNTDDDENHDDPEDRIASGDRFRAHFALPDGERLQAAYFGYLMRVLPLYGKIYISDHHFCFRSLLPGTRTKLVLPLKDVENVEKEKGFRFGYSGLVVVIRGHEELFFEFGKAEVRDDCAITLIQNLEATRYLRESGLLGQEEIQSAEAAAAERDALAEARQEEYPAHEIKLPRQTTGLSDAPTILFDDPKASFLNFKPTEPLRFTCLTIGSRGDVQPYIALCKGLMAEGHKVKIATHGEFQSWIESHGIEFGLVGGDPAELMQLCIENGTFTWAFLKEANSKFRGWLDELLASCWTACKDSDVLIESPSAMAGIHIAESLGIPYFRAFTMPWTRTRAYPHAFITPGQKMGGAYNYVSYVMFDNVFWKATAHQINRWRNKVLKLPNTNLEKLQPNKVPFLYNFSPYVVPPPLDYSDWIRVTGYWFLDEGKEKWTPPKELTDFIDKARHDGKKLVYVGFGSIIVPDPAKMTQEVIDAVLKADVRCVLSKGWSDRLESSSGSDSDRKHNAEKNPEPVLPSEIFQIKSAPHDWLFAQMDAAAHHGGSGTTGASLRAGIPTIVRPFFGDQFFFGMRVEDLGVGICLKKWGANSFARALWEATHSERMIVKARVLGEQIRKENGVDTAIQCIYRDLEYAKSLIMSKAGKNASRRDSLAAAKSGGVEADDDDDAEEESWTFVGGGETDIDDLDSESVLRRTMVELDHPGHGAVRSRRPALGSRVLSMGSGAVGARGVGVS